MTTYLTPDRAFVIRENGFESWRIIIAGKVIPATWPCREYAIAAIPVEQRRRLARLRLHS